MKTGNQIRQRRETIRGVVVPEQWDDQYQVVRVHIACSGEREVSVENLDSFPTMISHSRSAAIVTGTVRSGELGESMVVESFTPVMGAC